jgi:peptidoglycan DL-endopeptidase CwlO
VTSAKATRKSLLIGTALALAAGLLAGPGALAAHADPPLSVDEAKAQVEQLETEAAAIDQQYVSVREDLRSGERQLRTKQADVKAQTTKVARMRIQVGQVALAKFQNRSLDTTAQLFFTRDTDNFLSQISTVEKVTENQNTTLQDFQAAQARLAELERSSETDVADLSDKRAQLKKLRTASEDKIADTKEILAKLTKEEQERIAEEERKAREAALAQAKAAAAAESAAGSDDSTSDDSTSDDSTSDDSTSDDSDDSDSTSDDSGSTSSNGSIGERVVAYAKKQLGKPYRFAAEGPDAFDCSGLVQAAYKSVGVSLPRLADDQLEVGKKIARSDLRPGDLVGYYSPTSHIAIYIGDGKIIDAPNPRKSVRITTLDYMPYNFANRPVG